MKSILFAGIAVAALAGLAPAAAQTATAPGKPAAAAKPVTRADVAAKAQQQFTRLDANKDGAISSAEFDAAHSKRADMIADRGSRRGYAGELFVTADTNKDGRVSLAEATATATAHFDKADANKDGTLTRDEIRSARQVAAKKPAGR